MAIKLLVLGCGFLTSHTLPSLIPHVEHFILLDREKVEQVNYENYVLPREYIGKRKVTAFSAYLQLVSSAAVSPIHMNIKSKENLFEIHKEFSPDIALLGFDNIRARMIARDYAIEKKIPMLSAAVSENNIMVDWVDHIIYPSTDKEIKKVEEAMAKIRDVCTRIEFRNLGVLTAVLTYSAFVEFLNTGKKVAFMANTKYGMNIVKLKR